MKEKTKNILLIIVIILISLSLSSFQVIYLIEHIYDFMNINDNSILRFSYFMRFMVCFIEILGIIISAILMVVCVCLLHNFTVSKILYLVLMGKEIALTLILLVIDIFIHFIHIENFNLIDNDFLFSIIIKDVLPVLIIIMIRCFVLLMVFVSKKAKLFVIILEILLICYACLSFVLLLIAGIERITFNMSIVQLTRYCTSVVFPIISCLFSIGIIVCEMIITEKVPFLNIEKTTR